MEALYTTFDYENPDEINLSLYDTIIKNLNGKPVIGGGIMTSHWNLHKRGLKDINIICEWLIPLIPIAAGIFSQGIDQQTAETYFVAKKVQADTERNFPISSFDLSSTWGVHYTEDTHIVSHNHFPFAMSFIYCVRAPKGSSPLLIEEHEINLSEGTIVFFPANQYHGTLPTDTTGRCMFVGNIAYKFWQWKGEQE